VPGRSIEVGVDDSPRVVEREFEIVNVQGLHARPVMKFVDLAVQYEASVTVTKGSEKVDGKSPMEMMLLEAPKGARLHVSATGADAEELLDALGQLIAGGFGEE
jgi:phosphocarrier protein